MKKTIEIYKKGFDIYKGNDRRSYLVFDKAYGDRHTREEALREAKRHFKTSNEKLRTGWGWIIRDELYLETPSEKSELVFIIYKRRTA